MLRFERPAAIQFGSGLVGQLGAFARAAAMPAHPGGGGRLQRGPGRTCWTLPGAVTVFGTVKPEPDIPNLQSTCWTMAAAVRPDLVVGFGGGSAMDLAKLAAVLPGSGQSIHDVVGPEKVAGPQRRFWRRCPPPPAPAARPARDALVTDPATQNKLAVQSRHMLADLAVIDPDLTLTVPPAVTAATGVDAMAHCAEGYTSRKAHPLIDLYALEGIRLVGRFLQRAVRDGGDREARARAGPGLDCMAGSAWGR